MSWQDVMSEVSGPDHSSIESQRFGVSISRLVIGEAWPSRFASVTELYDYVSDQVAISKDTVLVVRAPSNLVRLGVALLETSRAVIPAGTLLYWESEVRRHSFLDLPPGLTVRAVDPRETRFPILAALDDSFRGYVNHYSSNPLLDPAIVVEGYREWANIALSAAAGGGAVVEKDGSIVGVATTRSTNDDPTTIEIELAGIVTKEQGAGVYRYLLDAVIGAAQQSGAERVVISTQSHNIRVQRAWASAGFRPVASLETLHCVKRADLRGRS